MVRKKLFLTVDTRTDTKYGEVVGTAILPSKNRTLFRTVNVYGVEDADRVKQKVRLRVTGVTKRIAKVEVF